MKLSVWGRIKALWVSIEAKVKAAGVASLFASLAVALLNSLSGNSQLLGDLPATTQFVILALIPPIVTALGGYAAAHTPRVDTNGD